MSPVQNLQEKRATSQYLRGLTFIDSQVVHSATDARLSLINADWSFLSVALNPLQSSAPLCIQTSGGLQQYLNEIAGMLLWTLLSET